MYVCMVVCMYVYKYMCNCIYVFIYGRLISISISYPPLPVLLPFFPIQRSLHVCITSAGTPLAYALVGLLATEVFPGYSLHFRLLDSPARAAALQGAHMSFYGCFFHANEI